MEELVMVLHRSKIRLGWLVVTVVLPVLALGLGSGCGDQLPIDTSIGAVLGPAVDFVPPYSGNTICQDGFEKVASELSGGPLSVVAKCKIDDAR